MCPKKVLTRSRRKSIHVFDLDDTLIQTTACIRVVDENSQEIRSLSPAQFTTYELDKSEKFDFSDFANVGILAHGIVIKYTQSIIETLVRRGTHSDFGIITARGEKHLHAPFLIRLFGSLFGIRLKKSLIFNLSDHRFSRHKESVSLPEPFQNRPYAELRIPERKALVIAHDLVGRGFNAISFYDDSRENLDSFKVIQQHYPHVDYHPHFIDPTWRMRLGEFRKAGIQRKTLIRGKESALILLENHSAFRAHPEAGLRELEAKGVLDLDPPDVKLGFAEGKFYLTR